MTAYRLRVLGALLGALLAACGGEKEASDVQADASVSKETVVSAATASSACNEAVQYHRARWQERNSTGYAALPDEASRGTGKN